jgi:transcriptional regulator with XRE-family HTH domain
MSSISKLPKHAAARAIGAEIRRRRVALGLTQSQLGEPFTRSYVSALERGHCLPSLPALLTIAARLGAPAGELLATVNPSWSVVYTRARDRRRHTGRE